MKRVNQKELNRLRVLCAQLSAAFADPARQSITIWRGDVRAIQWAQWWIAEQLPPTTTGAERDA